MSFIPPLTTLRAEDFSGEEKKWLPRLFTPLNIFLTAASNVINGRIEFGSNIPSLDQSLLFNYDGTPTRFRWTQIGVPKFVLLGQAFENDVVINLFSSMSYDANTKTVSISFEKPNGSALTIGAQYRITLRIIP